MMSPLLPVPRAAGLRAIALGPSHEGMLQAFFSANPEYFRSVYGRNPDSDQARQVIDDHPPETWGYTQQWLVGYLDASGILAAVVNVVADLLAIGVWHIGLFIVATPRHGNGDAALLHQGLVEWAVGKGAVWIRLGVVCGNQRAKRFWRSAGYTEVCTRTGVRMGDMVHSVKVMVKALSDRSLEEYLRLVRRDRPEPGDRNGWTELDD